MRLPDWLPWKRKAKTSEEITEGGSRVYRYDSLAKPRFGFSAESKEEFRKQREAAYTEVFGPIAGVQHETMPLVPHVDIYVFEPGPAGRDFYTLVTGGMSDLPMNVPEKVGSRGRRAEILVYCLEPKPQYVNWLSFLSHFPHDNGTWLGDGHTLPNGQPPGPLFPNSSLDTMLLANAPLESDFALREKLICDGDPVNMLWLTPISTPECDLKLKQGIEALLALFDREQMPPVIDENRRSYV